MKHVLISFGALNVFPEEYQYLKIISRKISRAVIELKVNYNLKI